MGAPSTQAEKGTWRHRRCSRSSAQRPSHFWGCGLLPRSPHGVAGPLASLWPFMGGAPLATAPTGHCSRRNHGSRNAFVVFPFTAQSLWHPVCSPYQDFVSPKWVQTHRLGIWSPLVNVLARLWSRASLLLAPPPARQCPLLNKVPISPFGNLMFFVGEPASVSPSGMITLLWALLEHICLFFFFTVHLIPFIQCNFLESRASALSLSVCAHIVRDNK